MTMESKRISYDGKEYTIPRFDDIPKIKIPSSRYKVNKNKELRFFDNDNTEECTDQQLLDIFDTVEPAVDNSIESAELLYNAFIRNGIEKSRVKFYTGWLYYNNTIYSLYPAFKSFVLVDDKYLFDFIYTTTVQKNKPASYDTETIQLWRLNLYNAKNSEKYYDRWAKKYFGYIASECTPAIARELLKKMDSMKIKPYGLYRDDESINSLIKDGDF